LHSVQFDKDPNGLSHGGVKVQKIPDDWVSLLKEQVTPEIIMCAKTPGASGAERGWKNDVIFSVGHELEEYHKNTNPGEHKQNLNVYRHYGWNRHPDFPPILQKMMDHLDCNNISMFMSMEGICNGSLTWHVDDYHVWAFNIEGETTWEYFSLLTGKIESVRLKPYENIITMSSRVSHRVIIHTETRASISMIQPFTPRHF